jgi:hypothetical protein
MPKVIRKPKKPTATITNGDGAADPKSVLDSSVTAAATAGGTKAKSLNRISVSNLICSFVH